MPAANMLCTATLVTMLLSSVFAACPMNGDPPADHPPIWGHRAVAYQQAAMVIDFKAVQADLKKLFTDSKDWWPADYGHCARKKPLPKATPYD